MPSVVNIIRAQARKLYPGGRAFKAALGGVLDDVHLALAEGQAQAHADAISILDSAIADNANFSEDDATDWERRLGISSSPTTPLADRMKAINVKLNYPGTDAPRQHYKFIEDQIRAAGFDVHLYENNFGGVAKSPEEILGVTAGTAIHSPTTYHGNIQHGGGYNNKVANYIEEEKDAVFVIGSNYRSTFYVAGSTVTTFANIPAARKIEFRQLLLQLKPTQTVGFLFVNYI